MKTEDQDKQDTKPTPEEEEAVASPASDVETDETTTEETVEAGTSAEDETGDLYRQMDSLQTELKEAKERYLRTVADLENFRKRAQRDKEETRRSAVSSLVEELLPVIDNFSMGLEAASKHAGGEAFVQGFEMILGQIQTVLRSNGVEEIKPEGAPFDPNLHESVAYQPSEDCPEGHVLSVERTGYTLNQRLIRPASVVVSKGSDSGDGGSEAAAGEEETSEDTKE